MDFLFLQDSRVKLFLEVNSLTFPKSGKKLKVKDDMSPYLNKISLLLIEIYSKAVGCQGRTSIFS